MMFTFTVCYPAAHLLQCSVHNHMRVQKAKCVEIACTTRYCSMNCIVLHDIVARWMSIALAFSAHVCKKHCCYGQWMSSGGFSAHCTAVHPIALHCKKPDVWKLHCIAAGGCPVGGSQWIALHCTMHVWHIAHWWMSSGGFSVGASYSSD